MFDMLYYSLSKGVAKNGRRLALSRGTVTLCSDRNPYGNLKGRRDSAMMIALEIFGAVAAALTIFSAGVAVGRYIEHKNDRQ